MKNLSLAAKIYSVLGLLALMAIATAAMGLWKMGHINEKLSEVVDVTAPQIDIAGNLYADTLNCVRAQKNLLLAKTDEDKKKHVEALADQEKQVAEGRKMLEELMNKGNDEE